MSLDVLIVTGKHPRPREAMVAQGKAQSDWTKFCHSLAKFHRQQLLDAGLEPITDAYQAQRLHGTRIQRWVA